MVRHKTKLKKWHACDIRKQECIIDIEGLEDLQLERKDQDMSMCASNVNKGTEKNGSSVFGIYYGFYAKEIKVSCWKILTKRLGDSG